MNGSLIQTFNALSNVIQGFWASYLGYSTTLPSQPVYYFNGYLDDFRLYSRLLSLSEIN